MTDINFQHAIDAYIVANTERRAVAPNVFRASELTGCVRQTLLRRVGLAMLNAEGMRRMQVGTIMHRFMQTQVSLGHINRPVEFEKAVTLLLHSENEGQDSFAITGHVDCWDGETVYDFKSTADVERSIKYPMSVGYIYQTSAYAHALSANRAVIVYVDKRNLHVEQKDVPLLAQQHLYDFCQRVSDAERAYNAETMGPLPDLDDCYACKHGE